MLTQFNHHATTTTVTKRCQYPHLFSRFLILPLICFVLALGITACGGDDITGSEDSDEETEEEAVSQEDGIETMIAFLSDNELFPDTNAEKNAGTKERTIADDPIIEALEDQDFVSTHIDDPNVDLDEDDLDIDEADLDDEDDGFSLGLWVGPEDHLIPNGEWRDDNVDVCKIQHRTMKPANSYINFKVYPTYKVVYAQLVDVETGTIKEQADAEGNGNNWLSDTSADAWDNLDFPLEPSEGPCGDKVGTTLFLSSEIQTDDTDGNNYFSHVESEVELEFNEEEGFYDGSGTIEHKEFTSSVEGDCTVPDGTITVHKLRLEEEEEIPEGEIDWPMEDAELVISFDESEFASCTESDDVPPQFYFDFASLRIEGKGQLDTSKEPWQYIFENWEGLPDDDAIIGRKFIDQTESGDAGGGTTSTSSEETLFELRRQVDDPRF